MVTVPSDDCINSAAVIVKAAGTKNDGKAWKTRPKYVNVLASDMEGFDEGENLERYRNEVMGKIVGQPVRMTLDSGAPYFCVPEDLVPEEKMLNKSIKVRMVHGTKVVFRMAKVDVEMGGRLKKNRTVRILPPGNEVLYPVALSGRYDDVERARTLLDENVKVNTITRLGSRVGTKKNYRENSDSESE